MRYMIGDDWRDLFDIVVVQARKPKFFTQQSRPFRRFNIAGDRMAWQRVSDLEKGQVYMEGTVFEFLKMTGWHGRWVYMQQSFFLNILTHFLHFAATSSTLATRSSATWQTLRSTTAGERALL